MNTAILNATDFKFVDFINSLRPERISKVVIQKLNAIKQHKILDNVNFSDDRLILIAYKTLCIDSPENIGVREWFIANKYFEIFADDEWPNKQDLIDFIFIKLGQIQNPETPIDSETKTRFIEAANNLNGIPYDTVPQFIMSEIQDVAQGVVAGTDVETEWRELLELSEMMIDSTSGKEKKEWKELKSVALLMLGE